jgi:hypothetical protein
MNTGIRTTLTVFATVTITTLALGGCGGGGTVGPDQTNVGGHQGWIQELTGFGMNAIWGPSRDLLYASGGVGFVNRYNAGQWEVLPTGFSGFVLALWGTSADNVYAIVEKQVMRFDGNTWRLVYESTETLTDIWGSSASDIFVVGNNGTIVHWDGTSWAPQQSGVDWTLRSVEGSGPDNVFVLGTLVGNNPFILHNTGSGWQRTSANTALSVVSLAVSPEGRAFAGSTDDWIYLGSGPLSDWYYLGEVAQRLAAPGGLEAFGTDGNGRVFRRLDQSNAVWETFPAAVRDLWSAPWGYVYGVGYEGQVVYHDGTQWNTLREARPAGGLSAIFGADGTRFVIGSSSYVFDGREWVARPLANPSAGTAGWAVSADFAIAVGRNGAINHWDGNAWRDVSSPATTALSGVWASSENDAFAVGYDGSVLRYDGSWSNMTTLSGALTSVHGTAAGDVWVAAGSRVHHYDGASWGETTLPTAQLMTSIWAVSPTNVFAVGYEGTAVRYNGTTWEELPTPTTQRLIDLWASGPDAVFALAEDASIIRFDGEEWVEHSAAPGGLAQDLWGDENSLFAAGYTTSVFRLSI